MKLSFYPISVTLAAIVVSADTTSNSCYETTTICASYETPTYSSMTNNLGTIIYTTTYRVTVATFCSTGLGSSTASIVQVLTGVPTPANTETVPPGYTTTVSVCNSCGPTAITATLTIPAAVSTGSATYPKASSPAFPPSTNTSITTPTFTGVASTTLSQNALLALSLIVALVACS